MKPIKMVWYSSIPLIPIHFIIGLILSVFIEPQLIAFICITAYIIGLIGTITLGVLTHFVFQNVNIKSKFAYVAIGFLVPTVYFWVRLSFTFDGLWLGALCGGFGAIWAYAFWYYAIKLQHGLNTNKNLKTTS